MKNDMQKLTAKRVGDERGWPTFDVFSDEVGFIGNFIARDAEDAIEQARDNLT